MTKPDESDAQNIIRNALGFLSLSGAPIVVALSGGPDSMTLCHALSAHAKDFGIKEIHAAIIDHKIRPESRQEAEQVAQTVASWPYVKPQIISVSQDFGDTKIQEQARRYRHDLLKHYCRDTGICHIFMAHHMDDQAETVLFRLAKGSGLDGLAGMRMIQDDVTSFTDGIGIVRPLLDVPKEILIQYCKDNNIEYVSDPSNQNDRYARVRMRQSWEVLKEEGLTSKRLAKTAMRLARAVDALEYFTIHSFERILRQQTEKSYIFDYEQMCFLPEEIRLRIITSVLSHFDPESDYGPRTEKIEALVGDLFSGGEFKRRSLGKALFSFDDNRQWLIIERAE